MSRWQYVVYAALGASAAACATGRGDDALDPLGSESEQLRSKKPPRDAAPDSPPPVDAPPGGDGFIDACQLPGMTKVTFNPTGTFDAHDEGVTPALDLPFPFPFYGAPHTKFWFTTNGQLGFGGTPGGSAFGQVTCPLPDARFATPILLVYSVDLVGRLEGDAGVCYATTGAAGSRKLVVTWKDSFFYEAWLTSNVTFSATLNEGTNVIDVAITRVAAPYLTAYEDGSAAALGEQSGNSAYAYSCFQPHAPEGTVIHYNP